MNTVDANVRLDGTDGKEATGYAYENHHQRPIMYFLAVMECHNEAYKTFGAIDSRNADFVLRVNFDLRADGDHSSYEKQGIV